MALLESGRLTTAIGPRALDVGCGTGADCRLLAGPGFDVVGVDFSEAALDRARAAGGAPRYVQSDLFALPPEVTGGPFDLIFDGGTIDDLPPAGRRKAARIVTSLAHPGSVREDLPTAHPAERAACYWLTRRSPTTGPGGAP